MTEIELSVDKTAVGVSRSGILTTGMVGVPVRFAFDHSWDGLVKTAVFRGGMTERDRILDGTLKTTVPAECLLEAGSALRIGVEGRSTDGELVIPTIWGFVDTIQSGAKASGKPGESLEHPAWAQVMALIGDLSQLNTQNKTTLVAAINELIFSGAGGGGSGGLSITDDGKGNVTIISNGSGGLSITNDGNGNVTITSNGSVSITDDGNGNVVIA